MSTKTKNNEVSTDVQSILDSINETKMFTLECNKSLIKEIQSIRQELAELTHEFSGAFEFYQDQIGNQAGLRWLREEQEKERAVEELKLKQESFRELAIEITQKYDQELKRQLEQMEMIGKIAGQQLLTVASFLAD
jgi:hypothetical protein